MYQMISDIIMPAIYIFAGISVGLLVAAKLLSNKMNKSSEDSFRKEVYYLVDIFYTVFVTMISIFPLLGMLGTVGSLLSLDISGDTELLKGNFFSALITTFWGIVFAVVFKLVNSFFQSGIEASIARGKELLDKQIDNNIKGMSTNIEARNDE